MKVLQVTTNYPTKENPIFGIFMKEQVESLEKYGVENTIFFSNGAGCKLKIRRAGMLVHGMSVIKLWWHLIWHKYDLIHCHSSIAGMILLLSGNVKNNKCIVSFQNDVTFGTDQRFFEQLYATFDYCIMKSTSVLNREKIIYLPNGVDMTVFKPMDKLECKRLLGLNSSKKYILFVDSNTGKKRAQKRRDRFDETLEILRYQYGYNDVEELIMIGVKREDVPIWMNAADLHLLCSDDEGSPNSVKECMCCNVPCVTTNVGNVRDMLEGAPECYVSESFDAKELAVLIDKSLKEHKNILDLRKVLINKELDKESVARKLYKMYSSLNK